MGATELKEEPLSKSKFIMKVRVRWYTSNSKILTRRSQEDSLSFVPAHQAVGVEELLNLTTFDLEGAIVLPLDPLIN